MPSQLIAWTHGESVQSATPPYLPRVSASPLANDRIAGTAGTVWALYFLSAPSTVACREQLAHSRRAGTIWSQGRDIHLFPMNPSLDTKRLIFATSSAVACQKTSQNSGISGLENFRDLGIPELQSLCNT